MLSHRLHRITERCGEAATHVAALFALSGVLAILAIPSTPGQRWLLAVVAAGDLTMAVVSVACPWPAWGTHSTAVIAFPGLALIGLSTWAFGGFAAGTGPFFVLFFAWLGLHHPPRTIVLMAPVAAVAYAVPLAAGGADAQLLSSTVILVPIAVGVALVISARVRAQAAAQAVVRREERWRAALTATLAHDVRTPLTGLSISLELIADDDGLSPETRELVESAALQTERLTRLSTMLLDLERVEQGRLRLDRQQVDLAALVTAAGAAAGVPDVKISMPPGACVWADPHRLEQVLVNLLSNAKRHGRPPEVVAAEQLPGEVRIWVQDAGPGVPPDRVATLFDRFASDASPDVGNGLRVGAESVGLGLWIVRLLVEAHGGSVHYEEAGPGARFVVRLPLASAAVAEAATPE